MSEVSTAKSIAIATVGGISRKLKGGQIALLLDTGIAVGNAEPVQGDRGQGQLVERELRKASLFLDGIVLYDAVLTPHDTSQEPIGAEALCVFPDAVKAILIGVREQGVPQGARRRGGRVEVVPAAGRVTAGAPEV